MEIKRLQLLCGITRDLAIGFIDLEKSALQIRQCQANRGLSKCRPKEFFALPQRRLRLLAFGHVMGHPAYDRKRDSLRAQGVVVFPDSCLPCARPHGHKSLHYPVFLHLDQILLVLLAGAGEHDFVRGGAQQFCDLVSQDACWSRVH